MAILKTKSKITKEQFKLVGALVPLPLNSFLSLYAAANGITRSMVINNVLENWHQKQCEGKAKLLKDIVTIVKEGWKESRKLTIAEFTENLDKELSKKGLDPDMIEKVIQQFIKQHGTN
jgi:hypothetical protein